MNFDISEIDNIEKYLIVVYSKLKENIFGSDIAEDYQTGHQKRSGQCMAVF